jgi:hypothetical protein
MSGHLEVFKQLAINIYVSKPLEEKKRRSGSIVIPSIWGDGAIIGSVEDQWRSVGLNLWSIIIRAYFAEE